MENDLGYKCCDCEIILEREAFENHLLEHLKGKNGSEQRS